jgi:HrpA-like RNA helicase
MKRQLHTCRRQRLAMERQGLPMWGARDALIAEARAHHTLIVVGETGSGKTTQIPQLLLEAGLAGQRGLIGCTQPRRVAAVTVARRVADEMGVQLGQQVGGGRCCGLVVLHACHMALRVAPYCKHW